MGEVTYSLSVRDEADVENIARAIHDSGGCCEYGYEGCECKNEPRRVALVALAHWLGMTATGGGDG